MIEFTRSTETNARVDPRKEEDMGKILMAVTLGAAMLMAGSSARAQVNLSEHADPEGFLITLGFFAAALVNFARETRIALHEFDYH